MTIILTGKKEVREGGITARKLAFLLRDMAAEELESVASWIESDRTYSPNIGYSIPRSSRPVTIKTLMNIADNAACY